MHFFLRAAREGNEELVSAMIQDFPDVLNMELGGSNALHMAAEAGMVGVVNVLLSECPQLADAVCMNERTALHLAAQEGHAKVIETLLTHKPSLIGAVDIFGWTALHLAASRGHEEVVQELLPYMTPAAKSSISSGQSALHVAAQSGFEDVVRALLTCHSPIPLAIRDDNGQTALHRAAEGGHNNVVELLLEQFQLQEMRRPKRKGVSEVILRMEAEEARMDDILHCVDRDSHTALHVALVNGFEMIGEMLLSRAPDLAEAAVDTNDTLLHYAARFCGLKFVERVRNLKRDAFFAVNVSNEIPFHVAVANGNVAVVAKWVSEVSFDQIIASQLTSQAVLTLIQRVLNESLNSVLHRDVWGTVAEYIHQVNR